MNIFCIGYRVVLHDDQNEMPFCNRTICNRYWYQKSIDMRDVLRLQNMQELLEQHCNVNRDPSRARLSRKIKKSVSFVYRKPLLMRKLEPRYDNPPLASSSLSILTKRFVLSIVKHCYMCVIGFLLKILHYSTIPYLFSLLLLFA